jgi:hypothetical protein
MGRVHNKAPATDPLAVISATPPPPSPARTFRADRTHLQRLAAPFQTPLLRDEKEFAIIYAGATPN